MIDLDEFALCTHNYATKAGGPEVVLMARASDTDIICIAAEIHNTVLCISDSSQSV